MAFAVHFAARSDVGLVRSRNEDSGYAGPHLLAVADGMGGHAGGNVASSLVMAALAPLDGDSHGSDTALHLLAQTIHTANASLATAQEHDSALQGMGTTLTALMRAGSTALALVHIGDSRAYLLRDGRFTQITKDHSFVQTLVDSGRISAHDAEHHPQRSLVTRVLTGGQDDEPDLSMREARPGDRYLICSDGLSDYLAADTITEVVTTSDDPDDAAKRLVDLALKAGAPDNVTCVIGDIVELSSSTPSHPIIVGAAAERRAQPADPPPSTPAAKAAALRREVVGDPEAGLVLAEEPTPRRRLLRAVLLTALVALALTGAGYAAWGWSQRQAFVAEADGKVAIYQGVHQNLGPLSLSSVTQVTDIPVTDLPPHYRDQVGASITAGSLEEARTAVEQLRAQAVLCRQQRLKGEACGSTDGGVAPLTTGPSLTGAAVLAPSASAPSSSAPSGAP